MTPVTYYGPTCSRCNTRSVWKDGLCGCCWRLLSASGHLPSEPVQKSGLFPGDQFERELRRWLDEGQA